jgi:hypothetical protein
VLNGDTFELWESLRPDCHHENRRLGCTEAEALARLERVLMAHATEIAGLGAFARGGANRVFLVPGDHDAALFFPSPARRAVAALNAPGRVEVAARGYWLSSDGAVYAEHGHQIAGDAYRFASWPAPFVREDGRVYLERTWGEQLTQGFYSENEPRYPILDNIAEEGIGLKFLVAADPATLRPAEAGSLWRFFLSKLTWQQFRLDLDAGDVEPPEWDLPATRRAGSVFLVESLLPDDRFRATAERFLNESALRLDLSEFTDSEVVALCDYRAALRRARRRLERTLSQVPRVGPAATECPRVPATKGTAFDYFWRSRNARFSAHLDRVRQALDRASPLRQPISVLINGHRHLPDAGFVPARNGESPVVLNSGAWQRTVTPFQIEELMKDRNWSEAEMLRQVRPEDLPGCYGVVWIDPYTEHPTPRFRFWREDRRWGGLGRDANNMAGACGQESAGAP